MGLHYTPAVLQSLMNYISYSYVDDSVVIYVHHVLIFNDLREELLAHRHAELFRMEEDKLYVCRQQLEFFKTETELLGLLIGQFDVRAVLDRKNNIKNWLELKTISKIRISLVYCSPTEGPSKILYLYRPFLRNMTWNQSGASHWNSYRDAKLSKN